MKILLCVFSLFVLFSCERMAQSDERASVPADLAFHEPAEEEIAVPDEVAVMAPRASKSSVERKLIRNGSMSFEVKNVGLASAQIAQFTLDAGGYLASEKQRNVDEHLRFEQVVRIPGDRLGDFMLQLEAIATRIEGKDFSTQDVTEEFVDLESRLTAKKEVEARYREIVKQAKTVRDILEVEDQIGNARAEIETIQGRLKYLSNKVSYSTVTLTYYEHDTIVVPGTGSKFAESFVGGWKALVAFLIALTATWPFLIIISVGAWLVMRRRRKEPKPITQPQ